MTSIWNHLSETPVRDTLKENLTVDTVIIGGGMAGILTALLLKEKGAHAIVLEADRIGSGQTKNTTAKITCQHNLLYGRLTGQLGAEAARLYADASTAAIAQYERIIDEYDIHCDFIRRPAYLYTTKNPGPLEDEARAAAKAGIPAGFTTKTALPFPVSGALCFPKQAQFDPMRFLTALSGQVTCYENTPVLFVDGNTVHTKEGDVTARHIVFATHYPFPNVPGFFFLRLYQERSYVIALKNAPPLCGMYLGIDPDGLSLRNAGSSLLLGGRSHRTGQMPSAAPYAMLRKAASEYFPGCEEIFHWSAQDCMTPDGIPYIGMLSPARPDWYTASGFNKWGMTGSMTAAMLLSDQILRIPNRFSSLFSPHRLHLKASAKELLLHTGISILGLLKESLHIPSTELDQIPDGCGGIIRHNGKKTGVYKDPSGHVYFVSVRCPHLGCELVWNAQELSWDCPCHGSRFDYTGKRIDNPARKNLS